MYVCVNIKPLLYIKKITSSLYLSLSQGLHDETLGNQT